MKTLYLDVYILIDFTVDLLAFYFASRLAHVPVKMFRLCLAAAFGTSVSVFLTLVSAPAFAVIAVTALSFVAAVPIAVGKIKLFRGIRFLCVFLIIEMFLGGAVTLLFRTLDSFIDERASDDVADRNLIVIAITVLLLYGSLKTLLAVFSDGEAERNVKVTIEIFGIKTEAEALVDSGNLAQDPMSLTPVMFLCEKTWKKATGIEKEGTDLSDEQKKVFRLIPIRRQDKTDMCEAFRPTAVYYVKKGKTEPISVIIALDKSRKDFGGYEALIPLSALS